MLMSRGCKICAILESNRSIRPSPQRTINPLPTLSWMPDHYPLPSIDDRKYRLLPPPSRSLPPHRHGRRQRRRIQTDQVVDGDRVAHGPTARPPERHHLLPQLRRGVRATNGPAPSSASTTARICQPPASTWPAAERKSRFRLAVTSPGGLLEREICMIIHGVGDLDLLTGERTDVILNAEGAGTAEPNQHDTRRGLRDLDPTRRAGRLDDHHTRGRPPGS